ncbi:tRNA-dihydrouridine synthase family protein [Spirochaetota bacterium]
MALVSVPKLLLAPMVELSHRALRELIAGFGGCERYYTEMVSASGYLHGNRFDQWFTDTAPKPENTAVQFFDSRADAIIDACKKLYDERAANGISLGGVDLNFGCSAPFIERSGGGVYWMKDPQKAASLVAKLKKLFPGLVLSAKIRLGYEESLEILGNFCIGLEEAGLDYLVVHPRLKHEKFRRKGRWHYVARLAELIKIPLIGNGDIRSFQDYKKAMDKYKPSGIMIGREAARQPWLFSLINAKEKDAEFRIHVNIMESGIKMLELIKKCLPEEFYLSRAKRFFFYFCDNLSFSHHLRFAIQNSTSMDQIESLWLSYFKELPADISRVFL